MNLSFLLYQLQKIDSQIDNLSSRNDKIHFEIENNDELIKEKSRLAEINSRLQTINSSLTNINEQVKSIEFKIQRNNSMMYGGKVTNPKELQDLEAELVMLNKQKKDLEENQLQVMIIQETNEKELKTADNEISLLQTKIFSKNSLLTSEMDNNLNTLSKLRTERKAILDQLSDEVIDQYENLRIAKNGIAVALLEDNCCSVCGSTFSPSESQAARSSTVFYFCPTCQRIIYGG